MSVGNKIKQKLPIGNFVPSSVMKNRDQTQEKNTPPPATRMTAGSILGTGISLPDNIVPNQYFIDALKLDTTDEWIRSRIGITERRMALPEETAMQFAAQAAQNALDQSKLEASEIDLILVATSTADYVMPSMACLVQQSIHATNASAFDVVSACAGFAVAIDVAVRYLASGTENILVVGVDLSSRILNWQDRSTSVFFGDGAGAVLLSKSGTGSVLSSFVQSSGNVEPLSVPQGGMMTMDGRAIWDFATDIIPRTLTELARQAEISVSDIDLVVSHQANYNILKAAADCLDFPVEKFVTNLQKYGNTMAASIPIALHDAISKSEVTGCELTPGKRIALIGFGAGLTWGGSILEI